MNNLVCIIFCVVWFAQTGNSAAKIVDVGVILDSNSLVGKIGRTCMNMALEDFYSTHKNTTFKVVFHLRDSKSDPVEAASAGIDLLKNVKVQAILGPQRSTEADFVIDIGTKAQVPVISPATSPSLSPKESPFFVRAAHRASFQAEAIAEIIQAFGWREAVVMYEDSVYGSGIVPFLTDSLLKSNTIVQYRSVLSVSASDDQILGELYKLMTMQTRVFVVHLLPSLASRVFLKAKEVGMMESGYAWIITESLTSLLDSVNSTVVDSMQGVLGLKPYVPESEKLEKFMRSFRKRFRQENPEEDKFEINVYGLWAYDSVTALTMAAERIDSASFVIKKGNLVKGSNLSELNALGTSEMGAELIRFLRDTRFNGLSGDFHIADGQLQPRAFEVVNVVGKGERRIGFWTGENGISERLSQKPEVRTNKDNLGIVFWPGESRIIPKGWEIPTSGKKLRVGVPVKYGWEEFTKVQFDPKTKSVIVATGFCIEVFKEVMLSLPYAIAYEFIPFETPHQDAIGYYNDLVYQIYLKNYDAVVGDLTILANRSKYVDFTLPYSESGVTTVVRIKDDERKNAWIFMKPLTTELWVTIAGFFIFIGFVVWVIEHRVNVEFRGPRRKQVGMVFWFSFSTLVFAHKEKVISNLSRFVLIVWVFVVLVLTSSYTANLTSMLTVQQLQPAVTDLQELVKNGDYIGYQTGSFITELLKSKKFDGSRFRNYSTFEEYDEALSKGSRNGGVDAIVDELPYLHIFLNKHCNKYTMVGPTFKTAGFGFAFPKASPLVPDVSRAVLNVTEGDKMVRLREEFLGDESSCVRGNGDVATSNSSLSLDSFKGIFLIAGLSAGLALAIFFAMFLHENKAVLASEDSVKNKLYVLTRSFNEDRTQSSSATSKNESDSTSDVTNSISEIPLATSFYHHHSDQDEGLSSVPISQPTSPVRDVIINPQAIEQR